MLAAVPFAWLGLACARDDAGTTRRAPFVGFRAPADVLDDALGELVVEVDALEAFVRDWEIHRRRILPWHRADDDMQTRFLMSSDFFYVEGSGTEAHPSRYLRWWDRHDLACANPFARFDEG